MDFLALGQVENEDKENRENDSFSGISMFKPAGTWHRW